MTIFFTNNLVSDMGTYYLGKTLESLTKIKKMNLSL